MAFKKEIYWHSNLWHKTVSSLGGLGGMLFIRIALIPAVFLTAELLLLDNYHFLSGLLPFSEWYLALVGVVCLLVALITARFKIPVVTVFLRNCGGGLICLAILWLSVFRYGLAAFWLLPVDFLFGGSGIWLNAAYSIRYQAIGHWVLHVKNLLTNESGGTLTDYLNFFVMKPIHYYAIYWAIVLAVLGAVVVILFIYFFIAGCFFLPLLPAIMAYYILRKVWNLLV